jgi:galactokinase
MEVSVHQHAEKTIGELFYDHFATDPEITVVSPGRINLIGEHTDYNDGFVLPAAINKSIRVAMSKRNDNEIHLFSIDKNKSYKTALDNLHVSGLLWPDYLLGVVAELQKAGYLLHGFSAAITGDIPIGAGLSSSAALECATIFALNELFQLGIARVDMVKFAQKAENNFVGLQCGIMDMFASMMGKKGQAIKLDCRSLEYEYFPLNMDGYKIVLLDTQVKHSLASSEYNTRSNECIAGVKAIQKKYPGITSLRDATTGIIEETITDPVIKKRCLFIVQEKERLLNGCKDLENGDLAAFGKKMYETHDGLQHMYEVSCRELDFLADECRKEKEIIGARMMGGGFGGCVITIMKEESIDAITQKIGDLYLKEMEKQLKVYITRIDDGTHVAA